jgi:FG-GAP repeat
MRRIPVVLVLVIAACVWPLASGVAHGSATTAAGSLRADFNNDGFADLAVGTPARESVRSPEPAR